MSRICGASQTAFVVWNTETALDGCQLADGALLGHVDTVQELTDILAQHLGAAVQQSSSAGHIVHIVASDLQLVLDVAGLDNSHTLGHLQGVVQALTEEVLDENNLCVLSSLELNGDGEMGVCHAHLVQVALGDTSDHVHDVRLHGAQAGQLLAETEPHSKVELVVALLHDVNLDMLEAASEGSAGASDGHDAGLDLSSHCTDESCRTRCDNQKAAETYHPRGSRRHGLPTRAS